MLRGLRKLEQGRSQLVETHVMNVRLVIVSAVATLAFISLPARSFGGDQSDKYPDPIKTEQEAGRLPIGTRVAFQCRSCKTLIDTTVDQTKTFLSWYDERQTHKCPNCRGTIAYKGSNTAGSRYLTIAHIVAPAQSTCVPNM